MPEVMKTERTETGRYQATLSCGHRQNYLTKAPQKIGKSLYCRVCATAALTPNIHRARTEKEPA